MAIAKHSDLLNWIESTLKQKISNFAALAGDASIRCYFRVTMENEQTWIIMDSPVDRQFQRFIEMHGGLSKLDLPLPELKAINYKHGWIIMMDLGDSTLYDYCLANIESGTDIDKLYRQSIDYLVTLQTKDILPHECLANIDIPHITPKFLLNQINELFIGWFCRKHLELEISADELANLEQVFDHLVRQITTLPKRLLHFDYHSRNLMVDKSSTSVAINGILDFQDAMFGPVVYDILSLLQDAYLEWPAPQVDLWTDYYIQQISKHDPELAQLSKYDWQRAIALTAMQRHLKNLGIFARLKHRDHKPRYLENMPLLVKYLLQNAQTQPDFHSLLNFFNKHIVPRLSISKSSVTIAETEVN